MGPQCTYFEVERDAAAVFQFAVFGVVHLGGAWSIFWQVRVEEVLDPKAVPRAHNHLLESKREVRTKYLE